MTPFYNYGKEFRIECDFDNVLYPFLQAVDLFDNALENRKGLLELRATVEFKKAYIELGSPEIWEESQSNSLASKLIDPHVTLILYKNLKQALKDNNLLVWEEYKQQFVENVLGEYKAAIDWICLHLYKKSIQGLINTIKHNQDTNEVANAATKLIELDLCFLTNPILKGIINDLIIANDKLFLGRLVRAINPNKQTSMPQNHRNVYALRVLSSLGFENKPFSKWVEFFLYFNNQLGDPSGRPLTEGFTSFDNVNNIRRLVKKHKIDKVSIKAGRPKKR